MSDYASHLTAKCDEWREKYPRRSAELHVLVRRFLGIASTNASRFAAEAVTQQENELIRVMLGWPDEYAWTPTPTGGADRSLPTGDR